MGQPLYRQFPCLLVCGVLSVLSHMPANELPAFNLPAGSDKIVHICLFFWVGLTAGFAWHGLNVKSIGLALCFGFLDEYHQSFVPGRNAELLDILADTVGVLIGASLFAVLNKKASEVGE